MKPWKTLNSKYLLRDQWLTVRSDTCETANGLEISPYCVLEYTDWAHVVAFDGEDRVLITRQYRHAIGRISTEIPCGVIEPGEAPLAAAQRELREETGCTAAAFIPLPALYPNPATHTNVIHTFLATGASLTHPTDQDDSEHITSEFVPMATLLGWVDSGEFSQALHVASLFLALRKRGWPALDGTAIVP